MGKMWEETRAGVLVPHGTKFGYDAVDETKKRRRIPATITRNEEDELNASKRKKLIATTRNLQRNFAVAGWAIRKHLDYVATFNFQCRTNYDVFNRGLEALMYAWSKPENCDISGRHSLQRFIRLAEQARTIDGDVLILQLEAGNLQAVESDRIATPDLANTQGKSGNTSILNGVEVDSTGRAIKYAVNRRVAGSSVLQFERWIEAKDAILLGYFDRFDQVRGVSRLAASVNMFQDLYECQDYALAKAKISQLFGLVTYRETSEAMGSLTSGASGGYDVSFGSGPFHLDLDDGDRAEILESGTPATSFQDFMSQITAAAIKALDIPYSFYDESFTNYSGARQALLQYEQSVESKRVELTDVLDRITKWKISQWIAGGLLRLPAGVESIDALPWDWVPAGIPWIDPMKEVEADGKAISLGLKSRQRTCRERGLDYFSIVDELAQEQEYAAAAGVSIVPQAGSAPQQGREFPPDEEEPEKPEEKGE